MTDVRAVQPPLLIEGERVLEGLVSTELVLTDEPANAETEFEDDPQGLVEVPPHELAQIKRFRSSRGNTRPGVVRGQQPHDGLMLTFDRKVSPKGWYQESKDRWVPDIPNGFGLPAGLSCPGKTDFCKSCYAVTSEQGKDVQQLVQHNFDMLRQADGVEAMTDLLTTMISRYEIEADKHNLPAKDRIFRIHWDGDFFSIEYARAWVNTVQKFPRTKFWVYTRSFREPVNVVPHLSGIDNLTVYLSTDAENVDEAHRIAKPYPDVKLAYCAEDYRGARELARDRPAIICPENIGRMALMGNGRGACVDCAICPNGKMDILFATSHKEDAHPQQSLPFAESKAVPVTLKTKQ